MFRVLIWSKTLCSKSQKPNILYRQVRGLLERKPHAPFLPGPSPKPVLPQNTKLTPPGYEVIYVCRFNRLLNLLNVIMIIGFGALVKLIKDYFTDPDWLERESETFGKMNLALTGLLATHTVVFYVLITKHVRIIFKKGDQFKSLFYGVFGPFTKKYVDHGVKSIKTPKKSGQLFCYLNDKPVIIHVEFLSLPDCQKLLNED